MRELTISFLEEIARQAAYVAREGDPDSIVRPSVAQDLAKTIPVLLEAIGNARDDNTRRLLWLAFDVGDMVSLFARERNEYRSLNREQRRTTAISWLEEDTKAGVRPAVSVRNVSEALGVTERTVWRWWSAKWPENMPRLWRRAGQQKEKCSLLLGCMPAKIAPTA